MKKKLGMILLVAALFGAAAASTAPTASAAQCYWVGKAWICDY
ncbi:hypothetical protein MKY88_13170 [Lysinibacillus sp. FSL R7-0073]|nr:MULTISPECIES: hypothetical protein [Lysinibacillus]MCR8853936.1 hypothetical protein [Lysinibacillus fusiformis]MED4671584.1 hypothetical protein [Lysinibacillus fusiformis]MED4886176.1 hypothetical protein [Lysinibacillus fusiformis]WKT79498.1 hypothetical protein QYY55_12110 [Lysinibacillus fusiformis]SCX69514.1 hypothetical protein SAMN02787108_04562 [Lysinibacillus fusiformis]